MLKLKVAAYLFFPFAFVFCFKGRQFLSIDTCSYAMDIDSVVSCAFLPIHHFVCGWLYISASDWLCLRLPVEKNNLADLSLMHMRMMWQTGPHDFVSARPSASSLLIHSGVT